MWHRSRIILNAGPPRKISSEQPIDIGLTLAMADLKARFIDTESGVVHYKAIRDAGYKVDFGGGDRELLETLLKYLDEGENKTFLKENRDRIRIRYQPYDWNLNQE